QQPRLPGTVDALLPGAAVPERLPVLPDGLRLRDVDGAARRFAGRDPGDHPQLQAVRALPGSEVTAADVAGAPLVRRRPPAAVRRRRLLLSVANHSLLIVT